MITKITRIAIVTIIVAIAITIIYLNSDPITVNYGANSSITLMGGVVYLVWFALGLAASLFFWIIYGVQTFFKQRSLEADTKKSRNFYSSILDARAMLAVKDGSKAKDKWLKLIKKDPTDIIARVELSKSLEQLGEIKEALKVIDEARAKDPGNIEVLIRAAELNALNGNKTAAIDNLALVHYHQPNVYAAKMARDLSEQINRIEDAIEYNKKFEALSGKRDDDAASRLAFLQLLSDKSSSLLEELRKFVTRDKSRCIEAVQKLATLEIENNNHNQAAEVLVRAAKERTGSEARNLWRQTISLWLGINDMQRAIAAAKTAVRSATTDIEKIESSLDLCHVLLAAGDATETLAVLDGLKGSVKNLRLADCESSNKDSLNNKEALFAVNTLYGAAYASLERNSDANSCWPELTSLINPFKENLNSASLIVEKLKLLPAIDKKISANGSVIQPAHELSTP